MKLGLLVVGFLALAVPANAGAAAFFLFDRPLAAPNDRVTVRTGNTPVDFAPSNRVKPSSSRSGSTSLAASMRTESTRAWTRD